MVLWGEPVTIAAGIFLFFALGLTLGFEFVNGFHDTANAVATVIYTNTLKPAYAVVWSGCWNLLGVLWSSGAVAYSIVALLPLELVLHSGTAAGFRHDFCPAHLGHHLERRHMVSRPARLQLAHADRRHHGRGRGPTR